MSEINVSEYFYSIQGEGKYQGYPAVFFRVQNCNLFCGQPNDPEFKNKCEKCKWVCDTIAVWKKGKVMKFEEILNDMKEKGYLEKIKNGAHLILTGGEPLLQETTLFNFLRFLHMNDVIPFVEVETNGTIKPNGDFDFYIDHYNVSPKLSNSGNAKMLRYNPEALKFHTKNEKSIFKFVTLDEEDTKEIFEEFINEFKINPEKVWLMPGAYNRKDLWKNGQAVAELCKKYNLKMSSRLHVEIWDKLTGV